MERLGGEDTGVPSSIRKVVVSSFIGTTIEWYDYFIYGTAAALVFPALFFPDFSELAGTLLSFSTFAVGFAVAPLIATSLYPTGGTTLIAVYVATVCTLSILCYALAQETYRQRHLRRRAPGTPAHRRAG